MPQTHGTISDQIIGLQALGSAGASGNSVERVLLRDGARADLQAGVTEMGLDLQGHGRSRPGRSTWKSGLFERIPPAIDHATAAVEADGPGWSVFTHDVSDALVPGDRRLARASVRRGSAAMAELHLAIARTPLWRRAGSCAGCSRRAT